MYRFLYLLYTVPHNRQTPLDGMIRTIAAGHALLDTTTSPWTANSKSRMSTAHSTQTSKSIFISTGTGTGTSPETVVFVTKRVCLVRVSLSVLSFFRFFFVSCPTVKREAPNMLSVCLYPLTAAAVQPAAVWYCNQHLCRSQVALLS